MQCIALLKSIQGIIYEVADRHYSGLGIHGKYSYKIIKKKILRKRGFDMKNYNKTDRYIIPIMREGIEINGFFSCEKWEGAFSFNGFSEGDALDKREVKAFIGATKTHFYVGILSEIAPYNIKPIVSAHFDPWKIIYEDSVEVWINDNPLKDDGIIFQKTINFENKESQFAHCRGVIKKNDYYNWNGKFNFKNSIFEGKWYFECEIPVSELNSTRLTTDGEWGINLGLDYMNPWVNCSLGNEGFPCYNGPFFKFVEDGIIVKQYDSDSINEGDVTTGLYLVNNSNEDKVVNSVICFVVDKTAINEINRTITIKANSKENIELNIDNSGHKNVGCFLMVTNEEESVIFSRFFIVNDRRKNRWDEVANLEGIPDFTFGYYPYKNKLTVKMKSDDTKVEFLIREKVNNKEIISFELEKGENIKSVSMPNLNGLYEIIANDNLGNVNIKSFERTIYEWEHNDLGKSRKVYPPFVPITMNDERNVNTVLKKCSVSDIGLLSSVETTDLKGLTTKDVLKGEMKYKISVNGIVGEFIGKDYKIEEKSDDIVIINSRGEFNNLSLATKSTFEYDGLLKVNLSVLNPQKEKIDYLYLDIPLDESVAKMMHLYSDGCRISFTDAVPNGEGIVWDSTRLITSSIPKNFCTYAFLGDEKRGLCWFCENDKGWSWDNRKPNLQIIRQDGAVIIRINLANMEICENLEDITFGILPSPVKPKTEDWRYRWLKDRYNVLGCDRHWFALGVCGSVYPANKDFKLWDTLKSSYSTALSNDKIEEFVKYASTHYNKYYKIEVDDFEFCARENLKNREGIMPIFYYNRSVSGCNDEYHTFVDEWGYNEFNEAERNIFNLRENYIIPSQSYIDYALWWYKKAFEHGVNKGVYLDNNFFICSYNKEMTKAYSKSNGETMPSTGVWELRELVKRTFVMMNELGMPPIHMAHMTSFQALPLLSFYTIHFDWEWHYSEGYAQTRFTNEYVSLLSTGEHSGTWPILLRDSGVLEDDLKARRAFYGTTFVYELIEDRYLWHYKPTWTQKDTNDLYLYNTFRMPILSISQNPKVDVFRFWDEREMPISFNTNNAKAIVYSVYGEKAIIVICSFFKEPMNIKLDIDFNSLGFNNQYMLYEAEEKNGALNLNEINIDTYDFKMIIIKKNI